MKESISGNWASHLPALLACVGSTHGPVLELGVGHFSTPILHALCGALGRRLVSVEADAAWADQFEKLRGPMHDIIVNPEYDDVLREVVAWHWGVAFVDESPGGERRAKSVRALLPVCEFVVVHDYWRENREAIAPLLVGAMQFVTASYEPPTLVASLTREIPEVLR